MNTFFIADTHFHHVNKNGGIIRYCNRPFASIEEMDETIIQNWNAKIKPGDRVYHCGDFCWGNREEILKMTRRLRGHIILMEGNHDNIGDPKNYGFSSKHKLLEIKLNGKYITLCHYAMRVFNKSHFDAWALYGHSHGTLPPEGKTWDVGVDYNNFEPLEFEELKRIMESRPHNFNWLERLPGYNKKEYEEAKKIEMS
jgi:Predicted phosphoesterase or phosphohydrolase